jgi:hypothetical protein
MRTSIKSARDTGVRCGNAGWSVIGCNGTSPVSYHFFIITFANILSEGETLSAAAPISFHYTRNFR